MLPGPGNSAGPEEAAEGGSATKLRHGGLVGLATASMAINLAVCEPPPGLDKDAYFLALWGIFLAGVAHVLAAVRASDDGCGSRGRGCRAAPSKLVIMYAPIAPFVIAAGLSVASFLW